MEEGQVILINLPTTVRGFVYNGEDGEPVIVANARLTREQNIRTYDHEKKHIKRGDLADTNYKEYA